MRPVPGEKDWQISGGRRLTPAPFLVAGIVNITPDSFSDGGRFDAPQKAVAQAAKLLQDGADMLDLGAESTRPGAGGIGHEEEWRRLSPVLAACLALRDAPQRKQDAATPPLAPFSIAVDTFREQTAAAALGLGPNALPGARPVDVINDVSGGSFEPGIMDVVAQVKPGYVLGHSPARPDRMQADPRYDDVADTLLSWFSSRMDMLVKAGLPEACIVLDPCIGFGKTLEHTIAIVRAIPRFLRLGRPLYFGISRKAFLGALTGLPTEKRDIPTQAATALLARAGVAVHRVHNVADAVATLNIVKGLYYS